MQIALALASALLAAATAEAGYDISNGTVLSTEPSPSLATVSAEMDAHIASVTHRPQGNTLPSDDKENQEEDTWKCDLLAWVRAPDLSPAAVFPAEARLSANGSDCSDIVKWEVGLRLKERGYVRLHALDVEFPSKPVWNSTNALANQGSRHKIIQTPFDSVGDTGFGKMINGYYDMLNNETFWEIHSSERVVYDVKYELATADGSNSIPLEAIRALSVHVPNTQFPPIAVNDYEEMRHENAEDSLASSETSMAYYFALTLRNGSIIERPAGRAGFLPTSDLDVSSVKASGKREETTVFLFNPRDQNRSSDLWAWDAKGSHVPQCDTDSRANFSLGVILPDGDVFLQGQNVTLNITISRVGNGSEVPAFLMVKRALNIVPTWALSFARSAEEGASLTISDNGSPFYQSDFDKLLRVTPLEVHEERRRRRSEVAWSRYDSYGRFWNSEGSLRVPLLRIPDESQSVSVEFQVPADRIPSFNTTFKQLVSALEFSVETRFLCEKEQRKRHRELVPTPDRLENTSDNEENRLAEDTEWTPFGPPEEEESNENGSDGDMVAQVHSGNVSITVVPSTLSPAGSFPVHYTSAEALAPLLLANTRTTLAAEGMFPRIGSELREEIGEEVRQMRYRHRWENTWIEYGYVECRLLKSRFPPVGGTHHAASLWQRKMYKEAQAARTKTSAVGGFVVQA